MHGGLNLKGFTGAGHAEEIFFGMLVLAGGSAAEHGVEFLSGQFHTGLACPYQQKSASAGAANGGNSGFGGGNGGYGENAFSGGSNNYGAPPVNYATPPSPSLSDFAMLEDDDAQLPF
jgi:hypothetical protein